MKNQIFPLFSLAILIAYVVDYFWLDFLFPLSIDESHIESSNLRSISRLSDSSEESIDLYEHMREAVLLEVISHTDRPSEESHISRRIKWYFYQNYLINLTPESRLIWPGIDQSDEDSYSRCLEKIRNHFFFSSWKSLNNIGDIFSWILLFEWLSDFFDLLQIRREDEKWSSRAPTNMM